MLFSVARTPVVDATRAAVDVELKVAGVLAPEVVEVVLVLEASLEVGTVEL